MYGDSGLTPPNIMSMIQVQMAMDLDGSTRVLSLPTDFPNGLITSQKPSDSLHLTTSRLQKDVSMALARIGFENVMENVITMKEVAHQATSLPTTDTEILSIDIANHDKRIAIEVDGPSHFILNLEKAFGTQANGSMSMKGMYGTSN